MEENKELVYNEQIFSYRTFRIVKNKDIGIDQNNTIRKEDEIVLSKLIEILTKAIHKRENLLSNDKIEMLFDGVYNAIEKRSDYLLFNTMSRKFFSELEVAKYLANHRVKFDYLNSLEFY